MDISARVMEPERLLKKLLVLSSFLILAGIISINVSFGSVRQFLFDYHHDSLTSIHPSAHVQTALLYPRIGLTDCV